MIDGLAFKGKNYHKNAERVTSDYTPCVICGKAVNTDRPGTAWVRVHNGGYSIVTDAEAIALNNEGRSSADMYYFPVGPDCLKRHPELKPYTARDSAKELDGLVSVPGFDTTSY